MDSEDYSTICSELDDISVRMLQLMKEYIDVKLDLEDLIKTGSLHLAKSRYIMGNKSVSVLQLPTEDSFEFTAMTRVVVSKDEDDDIENLKMELSRLSLKDIEANKEVRSRFPNKKESDEKEDESSSTKPKVHFQDPMKWFGVLVPQNLRLAQSSFNKAIDLVIECANLQLEMKRLEDSYRSKVTKKRELSNPTTC